MSLDASEDGKSNKEGSVTPPLGTHFCLPAHLLLSSPIATLSLREWETQGAIRLL